MVAITCLFAIVVLFLAILSFRNAFRILKSNKEEDWSSLWMMVCTVLLYIPMILMVKTYLLTELSINLMLALIAIYMIACLTLVVRIYLK